MEQQSDSTADTATVTAWVIAGTVVFRPVWSWAGPSCKSQSAPEPPVRDGQYQLFGDDELTAESLQAFGAAEDAPVISAPDDHEEPAHEDLSDPAVAKFVAFRLPERPAHDGRKGDVEILNAYDAIRHYDTQRRIYSALLKSCRHRNAVRIAEGVWRVAITNSDLASAADCSERSTSDAIGKLAAHGYILRHPEKWGGAHSSQYYVRDEAGMMAIFRAAGVKFARKIGKGDIALFRAVDEVQDDTVART